MKLTHISVSLWYNFIVLGSRLASSISRSNKRETGAPRPISSIPGEQQLIDVSIIVFDVRSLSNDRPRKIIREEER